MSIYAGIIWLTRFVLFFVNKLHLLDIFPFVVILYQAIFCSPSQDILNKRNPRLVPYNLLDERTKKTNRDSVNNAVRTLIGYGYNIEPPDQESSKSVYLTSVNSIFSICLKKMQNHHYVISKFNPNQDISNISSFFPNLIIFSLSTYSWPWSWEHPWWQGTNLQGREVVRYHPREVVLWVWGPDHRGDESGLGSS